MTATHRYYAITKSFYAIQRCLRRPDITLLALLMLFAHGSVAEVYKWVDDDGKVHFGDSSTRPDSAEKVELAPANSADAPPVIEQPEATLPTNAPPGEPPMTAKRWADQNCRLSARMFYVERSFVPCVPDDEVPVYLCQRKPPRKYRSFFGRQYEYKNVSSECGAEVYEGEILFLKKG